MRIEASRSTYSEAQTRCEAEGADLAVVEGEQMQQALEIAIKDKMENSKVCSRPLNY